MLHNNKKGISEIVSYVLLILLVLAISALVFSWAKSIIPEKKTECPDVSIRINDYNCSNNTLMIEITNKGLFDVNGWYVRVYDDEGKAIILKDNGKIKSDERLNATLSIIKYYDYEGEIKAIEIEPFVYSKEEILCSNAIVKQDVIC